LAEFAIGWKEGRRRCLVAGPLSLPDVNFTIFGRTDDQIGRRRRERTSDEVLGRILMTSVSVHRPVLRFFSMNEAPCQVRLAILRSQSPFELSLHPASRYLPSWSNSTDVISPRAGAVVWMQTPPTASHSRIRLSFDLPCCQRVTTTRRSTLTPKPRRCLRGESPLQRYFGRVPRTS